MPYIDRFVEIRKREQIKNNSKKDKEIVKEGRGKLFACCATGLNKREI